MKVHEFYSYAVKKFPELSEKELKSEINILLQAYLNMDFTALILNRDRELGEKEFAMLENALNLRKNGLPLQYILGSWDFMGMNFSVGKGVLIPREDTEALVRIAKEKLKKNSKVIDLCSGTGCIPISLEKQTDFIDEIYAFEYSADAFKYLLKNIKNLKSKVKAIRGDVFKDYEKFQDFYFDMVVSNPPYIKKEDLKSLQREVLCEPKLALDGGEDGLDFYRAICKFWTSKIKIGGYLAFEIGINQFEQVKNIMLNCGLKSIEFKRDINGIIRAIIGRRDI